MGMRRTVLLLASTALAVLLVSGVALAATVTCIGGTECKGTGERDTLYGTQERDVMYGYKLEDRLYGYRGIDQMFGGEGSDTFYGGLGNDYSEEDQRGYDTFYGEGGNDYFIDRLGPNRVLGGGGSDRLHSRGTLLGGPGHDYLEGLKLRGGPTRDSLYLGSVDGRRIPGRVEAFGGPGNDTFRDSTITPGSPVAYDRIIKGGTGRDFVNLQSPDDDTIYLADGELDTVRSCGGGTDTVYFDTGLDEFKADSDCENRMPR